MVMLLSLNAPKSCLTACIFAVMACGQRTANVSDAAHDAGPPAPFQQVAYVKASNTDPEDVFGSATAMSRDGGAIVVGAFGEASAFGGVDANQNDNSTPNSGAAYVFQATGSAWDQKAYLKSALPHMFDDFAKSVAISGDGATVAIGDPGECRAGAGINPVPGPCNADLSGAVFVFSRSGDSWTQEAYIKASNPDAGDEFGSAVALSSDGSTLVVAAIDEASTATGVNGDQSNNGMPGSGAVYVFSHVSGAWSQQAYIKSSNNGVSGAFGASIAISDDAMTLAVGTPEEDSSAEGVNGNENNYSAPASGAAYVFINTSGAWTQQAYIKASNTDQGDHFGTSVTLSQDGSMLAIGAPQEASASPGVEGSQTDNSLVGAGAAYLFSRSGAVWAQQAYFKASNPEMDANFGASMSLSSDARTLLVSAFQENSGSTGVNGDETNGLARQSGAAYVFHELATGWQQDAYVKASNTNSDDLFGFSSSVDSDGGHFVIGAPRESSSSTGVNGRQDNNQATSSGAAYVFDALGNAP